MVEPKHQCYIQYKLQCNKVMYMVKAIDMKCLRAVKGISRLDKQRNEGVREELQVVLIEKVIGAN